MERILEPELMGDMEQAEAYANADFEEPHSRVIELLAAEFQRPRISGRILDLGCGPGDITFRLARRFPEATNRMFLKETFITHCFQLLNRQKSNSNSLQQAFPSFRSKW